ncbi:MAG: zf-TFIIB domain-containing protein [Nocardioidaceae bacterium]|nr:zf-TFIIB domain-containing protein [Nocardioidaceae bacterium]
MPLQQRMNVAVAQCEGCHGMFLPRTSLADLVEGEVDWHAARAQHTQPLPRITPGMHAPPAPAGLPKRSYLDALFG